MLTLFDFIFIWILLGVISYSMEGYIMIKQDYKYTWSEAILYYFIAIILGPISLVMVIYHHFIKKRGEESE